MAKPKKRRYDPRKPRPGSPGRPEPVRVERVRPGKARPVVGPIQHNVPMPARRYRSTYPFSKLSPGDSFNVQGATMQMIAAAIASHRKRHGGQFRTERQEDGSVQVWKDSD